MDLSADNLSDQHHVMNTGHLTDPLALDSAPALKVREDGKGIFIIIGANTTEVFEQFSVFESTLATYLNGIIGITGIHSAGTLTARIIVMNTSD